MLLHHKFNNAACNVLANDTINHLTQIKVKLYKGYTISLSNLFTSFLNVPINNIKSSYIKTIFSTKISTIILSPLSQIKPNAFKNIFFSGTLPIKIKT